MIDSGRLVSVVGDAAVCPPAAGNVPSVDERGRLAKERVRACFDALAGERTAWRERNRYYYAQQERYFRFLVPENLRILEVGCGTGDLLAALRPAYGLGIDLSQKMVAEARRRHPHLEFQVGDAEALTIDGVFDVIILVDVVGQLYDVERVLHCLHRCCSHRTRVIMAYHNFLWEPLLVVGEKLGFKMPERQQNWLSTADLVALLGLTDFDVIKTERRLLLPYRVPFIANFLNRFVAPLPGIRKLCLTEYIAARIRRPPPRTPWATTVVIPCRNERGTIEEAVRRLPAFGGTQEIIFVDGRSSDGTPEEIRRIMAAYPEKRITYLIQEGRGKGDAVRQGFAAAQGDILMILDADLSVAPEDLPKFYEAIADGKGELIMGCRLVYPMEREAMRFLNLLGNKFFSSAFSWLLNQRIKDTLCGTKVLFRQDYERLAAHRAYFGKADPFGDFDLIFGAAKLNLKIVEIPVRYTARTYGTTQIRRFRHGLLLLLMTWLGFRKLKAF